MLDLLFFAVILAVAGSLAGIIAGLLGVGGGIVIVPVLFYLLPFAGVPDELRMHVAVPTSLATIIATSIVSARSHYKRGGVDVELLRNIAPSVVVGALIGSVIGSRVGGDVLTAVFGCVALLVAGHMAFLKGKQFVSALPGQPWISAIGVVIGGFSTMMGIGGGSLSVPTFTLCGIPIRRAVGTAAAIGLVIAVPAVIGFAIGGWGVPGLPPGSVGYVNLIGFALIAPLSMAFAPLGARLAHTIPSEWLSTLFAIFLAITAIRMLMSL
ncbi:sulfite exporter TauE/SafE family protein [Acuticoccus sp. I52.16.1]|uniref:sulfite exporter TauE/SafE family protein n=1 Tax=Acuticoccus sp. I52.16.1 TaxID=2928472 RepID=UPI001FD577BF|nr:sulfite exporter TauE/SafE family protein [Acuticoccus sp. I52.16.1]UOM34466.1 sulfite exporter TauE/SafE family protein [Acuticoccus sp. I52.16.1]